jgi:S1/P1 Nuclease
MYRKTTRTFVTLCLAFCLVALLPLHAAAWGRDGHQIVAGIALWRLDQLHAETTKNRIKAVLTANLEAPMLKRPNDLFAAATWPDDVRGSDEYSFADDLHFVSIPLDRYNDPNIPDEYLKARDCKRVDEITQIPEGVCIIGALEHYSKVLATSTSKKARLEALSFIVHFMGDLHQPLHTSEDLEFTNYKDCRGDRGGNHRFLFYLSDQAFLSNNINSCVQSPKACTETFGNDTSNLKLHAAWDKYMLQTEMRTNPNRGPDFKAYGRFLVAQLPQDPSADRYGKIEAGDFVQWARETHHVAEKNAYAVIGPKLKVSPADNKKYQFYLLNKEYRDKNILVVDEQLVRAGIRLAAVLQKIFPES